MPQTNSGAVGRRRREEQRELGPCHSTVRKVEHAEKVISFCPAQGLMRAMNLHRTKTLRRSLPMGPLVLGSSHHVVSLPLLMSE